MSRSARSATASRTARLFALCVTALLMPVGGTAAADVVTDWNARAGAAAVAACISPGDDPLHESRLYAMMHVAIHDALNAIDRRSRRYASVFTSEMPSRKAFATGGRLTSAR